MDQSSTLSSWLCADNSISRKSGLFLNSCSLSHAVPLSFFIIFFIFICVAAEVLCAKLAGPSHLWHFSAFHSRARVLVSTSFLLLFAATGAPTGQHLLLEAGETKEAVYCVFRIGDAVESGQLWHLGCFVYRYFVRALLSHPRRDYSGLDQVGVVVTFLTHKVPRRREVRDAGVCRARPQLVFTFESWNSGVYCALAAVNLLAVPTLFKCWLASNFLHQSQTRIWLTSGQKVQIPRCCTEVDFPPRYLLKSIYY